MRFPEWLSVFGDTYYRGQCRPEENEQIDFVAWMQHNHSKYADIMLHPKIEGKRTYQQARRDKLSGSLNKGASDIVIPCAVPFVCEIKRENHTKSKWQNGQQEYLQTAKNMGAFVCVALGFDGAKLAFNEYLKHIEKEK